MSIIQNQDFKPSQNEFYIVSTPIGNLEDITLRALKILKETDIILCEDTRKTIILLNYYNIKKKLSVYNDFNKFKVIPEIINLIRQGNKICLVSDAGTPAISDPGFHLIKELISNGIQIIPIPGANAAISALSASGMPTDNFMFLGFLPNNLEKIKKKINYLKNIKTTFVIYESPKRVNKTLQILYDSLGSKQIVICRELTKIFEEFIRANIEELLSQKKEYKGEIVIIIDNRTDKTSNNNQSSSYEISDNFDEIFIDQKIIELYNNLTEYGLNKNDILRLISKSFEISKNRLYDYFKK
ncbi:16S rRNA (cytidine(1402)-2'-O)-methyltransferase [Candidatus Dependentiae bacterium]|nr:16S rRNA (cytidine(1402)-2'-O)-methyltransferase [Candidatus Dependentiae bacterium]